jgi:type IV secretory pathway TrbD component
MTAHASNLPHDATPAGSLTPTAWVIHASLIRPVLTLGVERPVASLEATLCLALLLGVGVHLLTLALVAVVVVGLHPVMVWMAAHDPAATMVFIRSCRYADYYAPRAALWAPSRRPRPSIPSVR